MRRSRRFFFVALLGIALLPNVAWSQSKVAVVDNVQAVLKLKVDIRQAVAAALDDLHVGMIAIEALTPADAACADAACFSAVAKRLGATHLLLMHGVANPAGYRLNLDIRDGQTGQSLGTDSKVCELCADDQFAATVRERVSKLWPRLVQEPSLNPEPSPLSLAPAVPPPGAQPGVDTSAILPWWEQPTPMMGVGFSAVGALAIGFGLYYVAVDGNTVQTSKDNPNKAVIVRDTGKWGWSLFGVGAVSLLAGSAMVIWGRDDGTNVSVAVGPHSLGLQGKF
jgi:hypothetical protein